jgi:hypothetical protein
MLASTVRNCVTVGVFEARAVAWTAWVATEGAPEAFFIITDASRFATRVDLAVKRAFCIATIASPTRFTLAITGVHRLLLTIDAWISTSWTHPTSVAVLARWLIKIFVASATFVAVWLAWTIVFFATSS